MSNKMAIAIAALLSSSLASAAKQPIAARMDSYLRPYVESGNFSGSVLVKKQGKVLFHRAYGFADRQRRVRNTTATRFHIASVSMQFTAAAILRLVDEGAIRLDDHIGSFLPGTPGAEKITVRDLLEQRSGLPDINGFPDYDDILQHHQTPSSLVAKIEGHPLVFEPGSKFLHEEHSAYNVLALMLERKTGQNFASAVKSLVLVPAGLRQSGVDDDSAVRPSRMAIGYEPEAISDLKPATTIHWSAKTGNASVYSTVADEAKLVDGLLAGTFLSASSRGVVLDTSKRVGYGWFRGTNKRFDETAYYMNGRAPGFSSFVLCLPREQITTVVFSNVYSSATTAIGYDITAIALDRPYNSFQPSNARSPSNASASTGRFRFGADFYQPNAEVTLVAGESGLTLRWPSGDASILIPMGADHFMDRSYWEEVKIERGAGGQPLFLVYGEFRGKAVSQ